MHSQMDIFGLLSVLFPVPLHLSRGPQRLRPDGPRCTNQNQIRAGPHAYLPSVLSRGDLRFVRHEHQRAEYPRLPVLHRPEGGEKIERGGGQDLSPAPYVCVEGFGSRHGQLCVGFSSLICLLLANVWKCLSHCLSTLRIPSSSQFTNSIAPLNHGFRPEMARLRGRPNSCKLARTEPNSMACTNASSARAAAPPALPTGGMLTNTWARRC